MIKLAPSRRMLVAGRQPVSLLLAMRLSGAFNNIRKNLFLTLLNFNDPFELCHQHLIIPEKKSPNPDSHMACWQIHLPNRGACTSSGSSVERFNTDFFPWIRALFLNRVCKYRPDEASQKRLLGYYWDTVRNSWIEFEDVTMDLILQCLCRTFCTVCRGSGESGAWLAKPCSSKTPFWGKTWGQDGGGVRTKVFILAWERGSLTDKVVGCNLHIPVRVHTNSAHGAYVSNVLRI